MPPHIRLTWAARYAICPWDGANRKALGQIKYKPPSATQEIVDQFDRKAKRRRQTLTLAEIKQRYRASGNR